jgi:glycosyltransferase involved in cell wall biosynthesis
LSDPTQLRILVLASTFPRWEDDHATPPFVLELCRRLARHFDVTVLAPHASGTAIAENIDGIHVQRYRYAPERWERLAYNGGILAQLRRQPWLVLLIPAFVAAQAFAVRRLRQSCDVVHAHWVLPQGLVAVVAAGRPVLCTAHGGDLYGLRSALAGWLRRWTLRRVDRLSVVSPALLEEAQRHGLDPATVVVAPMGVDLRTTFTPGAADESKAQRLLFVGRLVEKKGVATLIRALPMILECHPQASLEIIGDGPERAHLEELARQVGATAAVRFVGPVANHDLPARFRAASVVVFPSLVAAGGDREGFGLVAVEAMGCGCAVVGSDLPAMQGFLRHEETGLVTAAGDHAELAAAINRLLEDPLLGKRLGSAGRRHVLSHYDWETVADTYHGLLQNLADHNRSGMERAR